MSETQGVLFELEGITVTHAASPITQIVSVVMPIKGTRREITLNHAGLLHGIKKMGKRKDWSDIVITKVATPAADSALSDENGALVISLPTADGGTFTATYQAEFKESEDVTVELDNTEVPGVALTYSITNLNASGVVTPPDFGTGGGGEASSSSSGT